MDGFLSKDGIVTSHVYGHVKAPAGYDFTAHSDPSTAPVGKPVPAAPDGGAPFAAEDLTDELLARGLLQKTDLPGWAVAAVNRRRERRGLPALE